VEQVHHLQLEVMVTIQFLVQLHLLEVEEQVQVLFQDHQTAVGLAGGSGGGGGGGTRQPFLIIKEV
jgi:hypothetical protein